jgi:lipoate-protein ligase A
LDSEVHDAAVAEEKIPILRRTSGGGAVMQGPGCLNYALVLDAFSRGLTNVRETFRCVLKRHAAVIGSLAGIKTRIEGISDLALDGRKFSGNAQYRKSRFVLVHGTFLLRFDLPLIERFLKVPARQPDYRANRPHIEFLTNLNLKSARLADALSRAWDAREESIRVPMERIQTLIDERYGRASWTKKF